MHNFWPAGTCRTAGAPLAKGPATWPAKTVRDARGGWFAASGDAFPGYGLMDSSDSHDARSPGQPADGEDHAEADRAAEGLRGQIAALRKQVRDAQDTLRGRHQRQEGRSFKR